MSNLFREVILITNEPDDYELLGLPTYEDVYAHKGPLAGIHSGLLYSTNEMNFVISCDLPFISTDLIKYLLDYKTDKLITAARADGFIQQLAGRYSKKCLSPAEDILKEQLNLEDRNAKQKKRGCNVLRLLDVVGAEILSIEDEPFYNEDLYFNMNKTEDYDLVFQKLENTEQK
jgi:molybdopterin-guanine dinucleotide biosynthesis protein A